MLSAWIELIDRDLQHDRALLVQAINIGMSGDAKEIKKTIKKWMENV